MDISKYLPKDNSFALLKIAHSSLYKVEESDELTTLLAKQSKPVLDSRLYVIDKEGKFQHKLKLNESLDLKSVNV